MIDGTMYSKKIIVGYFFIILFSIYSNTFWAYYWDDYIDPYENIDDDSYQEQESQYDYIQDDYDNEYEDYWNNYQPAYTRQPTQYERDMAKKCFDNFLNHQNILNQNISNWIFCHIKWNISSNWEKIFHNPHCASYTDTLIWENKWEKYFCSEDEAIENGFRKAKNCCDSIYLNPDYSFQEQCFNKFPWTQYNISNWKCECANWMEYDSFLKCWKTDEEIQNNQKNKRCDIRYPWTIYNPLNDKCECANWMEYNETNRNCPINPNLSGNNTNYTSILIIWLIIWMIFIYLTKDTKK